MLLCDLVLAYADGSGGIRTYVDNKRRHILEHTDHSHLLIVPGEDDAVIEDGRSTKVVIASPQLPKFEPYRVFLRPDRIRRALDRYAPSVIELANFFVSPWAAFSYRKHTTAGPCIVGGYFHTDVADVYVGAPLHDVADHLGGWTSLLASVGGKLADAAESGMAAYIRSVFNRCDLKFAASQTQVQRLAEYGVYDVTIVPLGVDLQAFRPELRSESLRNQWGAGPATTVLFYGGRLVAEKHVDTLLDAFERLPAHFDARLLIQGDGNLKHRIATRADRMPHVHLLPYEQDPSAFAVHLASADIYVSAGPHETFGLSVAEAQAAGLPTVGVRGGALIERVPLEVGMLGEVDDSEAMARNIVSVASRRSELALNARRHAEENYDWSRWFDMLVGIYEQEIERRSHPARGITFSPSTVEMPRAVDP